MGIGCGLSVMRGDAGPPALPPSRPCILVLGLRHKGHSMHMIRADSGRVSRLTASVRAHVLSTPSLEDTWHGNWPWSFSDAGRQVEPLRQLGELKEGQGVLNYENQDSCRSKKLQEILVELSPGMHGPSPPHNISNILIS